MYELDGVTPVTSVTDVDGFYVFEGFPSGQYRVVATPPAGALNTYDLDGTLDSDSGTIDLAIDSERNDVDFGYRYFGSLVVNKSIVGPGGESFGAGPFEFSIDCTFDGVPNLLQTLELTPEPGALSVTSDPITGLPEGTECIVTETDAAGADTIPAPVTVQIVYSEEGEAVIAHLTNAYSAASLSVAKVLDGTAADDATVLTLEFDILVTCQVATQDEGGEDILGTVYSGTVTLRGGETVEVVDDAGDPVLLPRGTHCYGEETDTSGAVAFSVDFDSYENAAIVTTSGEQQQLTITATNTFDLSEIVVRKVVEGAGSAGPYSFTVECSLAGKEYLLADSDAAFELSHGESRTIQVPVGTECVASEIDVPAEATMTVVDTDDSTEGGLEDGIVIVTPDGERVTVTNSYPAISETGELGHTGAAVSVVGLAVAVATMLAGAVLIAVVRGRREAIRHHEA